MGVLVKTMSNGLWVGMPTQHKSGYLDHYFAGLCWTMLNYGLGWGELSGKTLSTPGFNGLNKMVFDLYREGPRAQNGHPMITVHIVVKD